MSGETIDIHASMRPLLTELVKRLGGRVVIASEEWNERLNSDDKLSLKRDSGDMVLEIKRHGYKDFP